jgi:uncharacterized Zn finger protein
MMKHTKETSLLDSITQDMVARLDHERTNGEGWIYYSNGRIVYATVYQNEMTGIVREFRNDIHVKINLDKEELHYSCDCETDNGMCKHIVALLYSWVFDSTEFINMADVILQLEEYDKPHLISVLERLLLNDPQNIRFLNPSKELEYPDFFQDED